MHLLIRLAGLLGVLAIAAGAFGAHGLKDFLAKTGRADWFEKAVSYHIYHTLALLALPALTAYIPEPRLKLAGWAFIAGILFFSGSLYTMTFTGIRWLGAITPIGGIAFIIGWVIIAFSVSQIEIR